MELREMIEAGTKRAGTQANLSKVIGIHPEALTSAKAGKRGLPTIACFKLAELIEIDVRKVIAASELVTEKNAEKRAFFAPFVLNGISALATAATALTLASASTEANASNTFKLSTQVDDVTNSIIYDNQKPRIRIMRMKVGHLMGIQGWLVSC